MPLSRVVLIRLEQFTLPLPSDLPEVADRLVSIALNRIVYP